MTITFQPQPLKLSTTLTMRIVYLSIILLGITTLNFIIASWISNERFWLLVFSCYFIEGVLWIWYEIKHAYRDDDYDEREELWRSKRKETPMQYGALPDDYWEGVNAEYDDEIIN